MTTEPTGTEPAVSPRPVPKPRAASEAETVRDPDHPAADAPTGTTGSGTTGSGTTGSGTTGSGTAGSEAAGTGAAGGGRNWPVVVGSVVVLGLGIGWFLLSLIVFHDPLTDSLTEGIGAALGLLVAISIIGAIVSARGNRNRPAGS